MPTQIIDGFKLNAPTPIDSRLVTTGTASRDLMVYTYEGLRVYDTIQKKPFVYINGAWSEESGGVTTTSTTTGGGKIGGDPNYIPKITEYGTTSSNIREYVTGNGNERWIGINVPKNKQILATLHVFGASQFDGQVTATTFAGELPAANITGILALNKIANANEPAKTYVLKSENNSNKWVEETTGSKIVINKNSTEPKLFLVLSKDKDTTEAGNDLFIRNKTTSDLLAVNALTGQLMLGTTNTYDKPQYSFVDTTGTGMYGNTTEIGLSMLGNKRIYVTSDMVGINIGTTNTVKFEAELTTISTATTTISGTTFSVTTGATTLGGTLAVTGATTLSSTLTVATGKATTLGGTLTVNGNTSISGANTFTVGTGATTLGGTLTVNGNTSISGANTFTVGTGATTLGGTLAVTGATTLSSTLTISTNTSPGIKITSSGEFLRSIQSSGAKQNFLSFYKTDTATPSAANGRRGYIGYGSPTTDVFYIYNETATGSINFHTNGSEMLSIGTDTITVKSGNKLDLSEVVISAMRGTNEFNFVNNNNFSQADKSVYINYRGVSSGSISSYRFLNGSGSGTDALSPIVTGGIELKNGNLIHRIVVGAVNVSATGGHTIINGGSFVEKATTGSTTGNSGMPTIQIKFKTAMPTANYSVFASFKSFQLNMNCIAQVIDASNFKISFWSTTGGVYTAAEVEINFMAVCYDN